MYTLSSFPHSFLISKTFPALFRRAYLSWYGSPEALTSPLARGSQISLDWCYLSSTLTLRSSLVLLQYVVKYAFRNTLYHDVTLICYLALPPFVFMFICLREKFCYCIKYSIFSLHQQDMSRLSYQQLVLPCH